MSPAVHLSVIVSPTGHSFVALSVLPAVSISSDSVGATFRTPTFAVIGRKYFDQSVPSFRW